MNLLVLMISYGTLKLFLYIKSCYLQIRTFIFSFPFFSVLYWLILFSSLFTHRRCPMLCLVCLTWLFFIFQIFLLSVYDAFIFYMCLLVPVPMRAGPGKGIRCLSLLLSSLYTLLSLTRIYLSFFYLGLNKPMYSSQYFYINFPILWVSGILCYAWYFI